MKPRTSMIVTVGCLLLLSAAAASARPFVRGTGCTVSENDTIVEMLDCFGDPLYKETVEQYRRVRGDLVVKIIVTIFYYRIDDDGMGEADLFGFYTHRGEILRIERISK